MDVWVIAMSRRLHSGKRLHNYGKSLFLMGKLTISMAMFNSYISLPEGKGFDTKTGTVYAKKQTYDPKEEDAKWVFRQ